MQARSPLSKQAANPSIIGVNGTQNEKISPGLAKRVTALPKPSIRSENSADSNAINLKIQNALDRNIQKLNLAHQTNLNNNNLKKNANLTKEEIELFTNSLQNNLTLNSDVNQHLKDSSLSTKPMRSLNSDPNNDGNEYLESFQISTLNSKM